MIPARAGPAVLAALLLAACASTPSEEVARDDSKPDAIASESRAPPSAPVVTPSRTVDANQLARLPAIVCRDVLKPGSNVLITQCMTVEGWKAYERREADQAEETVRMLQGSRFR